MQEAQERQIDEVNYRIIPFDPFKGARLFTKIVKLLGKPLGEVMAGRKGLSLNSEIGGDVIGKAIEELSKSLDENLVESIMKDSLDLNLISVSTDGTFKKLATHGHFNTYGLLHMVKVIKFSWEVNYKDFLGGLGDLKK